MMFGGTSAMDGDDALAVSHDDTSPFSGTTIGAGAVWTLERGEDLLWRATGAIQSDETDQLGWAVAIEGGTAVLGAPGHGGRSVMGSNLIDIYWFGRWRAFVMEKDGNGSWQTVAILEPGEADWNAGFGSSLDISGK